MPARQSADLDAWPDPRRAWRLSAFRALLPRSLHEGHCGTLIAMKFSVRSLVVLACAMGAAGCGPAETRHAVYKAGGKVTLADGSPLAGGRIEFQPVEPAGAHKMPSAKGQLSSD